MPRDCLFGLSIPRDPLANIADVVPQPIFGPSLSIGGQTAQWNGQRTGVNGQVGVACRVIFDADVGDRVTSHLDICNDGTTAIYFSWKVLYDISFQSKCFERTCTVKLFTFIVAYLPGEVKELTGHVVPGVVVWPYLTGWCFT